MKVEIIHIKNAIQFHNILNLVDIWRFIYKEGDVLFPCDILIIDKKFYWFHCPLNFDFLKPVEEYTSAEEFFVRETK